MSATHPAGPIVSIVTPAFNAEHFIAHTIESVLRQTFTDFELLVIDDGSDDGTSGIAERYAKRDSRIHLSRQTNRGIAAARNSGIKQARGRLIALLDSDDLWLPTFLCEQLAILEEHPEIAILSANALNFGGPFDGEPLLPVAGDAPIYPVPLLTLIQQEDSLSIFAVFRRELFDAVGTFDETLHRSEDYDLWLRAASAGLLIAVNPRPLGLYRRRADSLSADEALMLDAMKQPLAKVQQAFADRPDIRTAIDAKLVALAERRLVAKARTALVEGDMAALPSRFAALADATGSARYRFASWLSGKAPATIRWAYRCKRTLGQLSPGRRSGRRPPRALHSRTRRADY